MALNGLEMKIGKNAQNAKNARIINIAKEIHFIRGILKRINPIYA